ncbi:MAG TPA: tetratricopeptide repeat protein [Terriglobales bacterium]|nr:tetratricopeptide repeat protein [Terriglobales bacterium]
MLLLAAGIAAYSPALGNGFVWDDNFQIGHNPFVHGAGSWSRLLSSDVWGYMRGGEHSLSNYYRPMQMLTYRVTAMTAGLDPRGFHAASLIFNFLATIAAYALFLRLTRRWGIALAAALIFAVHPMHSEAVTWVSALTELGCALFYFLAFRLFVRAYPPARPETGADSSHKTAPEPAPQGRIWSLAGAGLAYLAALLFKEMALTFPLVLVAWVLFTDQLNPWKRALLRSAPFWLLTAAYIVARVWVLGYFSRVQHAFTLSPLQYVLSAAELVGQYWLRLLVPVGFNAFHIFHPAQKLLEPRAIAALLFLLIGGAAILFARRRAPLAAFAAAWVFITLVPVLNLRGVGENVFAERYLYIPSLGFALLVTWAGAALIERLPRQAARVTAIVLVAGISLGGIAQTRRRVPDWKDDYTLYARTVEASPDSPLMRASLANVLRDRGMLDAAEREYNTAIEVAQAQSPPDNYQTANALVGLAGIAHRRGQLQQALDYVNRALAISKDLPGAHVALGLILLESGRTAEARDVLLEAHKFFPYDEVVINGLGVIALTEHKYDEAIGYFQQTTQIVPNFADGFNNLGMAYRAAGRVQEAIPVFQRAVALAAENGGYHHNLALALAQAGRMNDALPSFQRAAELAPQNAVMHTDLGVALARLGRYPEARAELERALQITPSYAPAVANLNLLKQVEAQQARR